MHKKELRQKYKTLRQQLSEDAIAEKSMAIANKLVQLDIWDAAYYHIFLPIQAQKEIDTEFILHILQGKDKHIVISRTNFENFEMSHYLLTDQTKIVVNPLGIPEPDTNSIPIPETAIEVVFVPLLAYDIRGNRVGYGKGFYDRFLRKCKPKHSIGLSFFSPEEEVISNVNAHDIKLDFCVHPNGIIKF